MHHPPNCGSSAQTKGPDDIFSKSLDLAHPALGARFSRIWIGCSRCCGYVLLPQVTRCPPPPRHGSTVPTAIALRRLFAGFIGVFRVRAPG